MTPRPHARKRSAAVASLILAAGLMALAGCDPRPFLYFLQPWEPTIAPPGPSLQGKRVVLLTHAVEGAQGDFLSLDRGLAREVGSILRSKIKKIDLVNQDKVWDWVEGHPSWTDPAEVAKDFEADMVIFLEIESFQVQDPHSPGLLEGHAKTHIQAIELDYPKNSKGKRLTDQEKESRVVYDDYRDTDFPRTRGPIPIDTGVSLGAFKTKFLQVVAAEISWHFAEHSTDEGIEDARINTR
jgi:hypothetical protein